MYGDQPPFCPMAIAISSSPPLFQPTSLLVLVQSRPLPATAVMQIDDLLQHFYTGSHNIVAYESTPVLNVIHDVPSSDEHQSPHIAA
ncbi:hypothetical protein V6N11_059572 [Hibiscus sabdariffa]|uniref:Uncharacterized protein n=1 Tax=Hibiscus sabdariffa TaxID=183260 RepID=A0ABR2NPF1_9ROSI